MAIAITTATTAITTASEPSSERETGVFRSSDLISYC
jgi:hypothetical protein